MMRTFRWLWAKTERPRQFTHDHPVIMAFLAVAVSTVIAVYLIDQRADDDARAFRHASTLNDYAGCRSGNRLRESNIDFAEDVNKVLGPQGQAAFAPALANHRARNAPRDCTETRARAIEAGVTAAELAAAEKAPPIITVPVPGPDGVPGPETTEPYRNCEEARQAGAAPVAPGDPGYGPHLDSPADEDLIGCE